MSSRARIAIIALAIVFALIQLVVPTEDDRTLRPDTQGTAAWGYRAMFDVMSELGIGVTRFTESIDRLPAGATAWWIAAAGICVPADAAPEDVLNVDSWLAAGGTAVVFLPNTIPKGCRLGDQPLPDRVPIRGESLEGLGPARRVALQLARFDGVDEGWVVRARLDKEPFVIERVAGTGRIVAVADATILNNQSLLQTDAAPFMVDLVRAFGTPTIVEEAPHAVTWASRSAIGYLATSPAASLFVGLLLLGLVVAWRGTLVPPRTIDGPPLRAPTLHAFVESVAALYATSPDHARVLARYRDFTVRRLRHHLGLPPQASVDVVVERIARARPHVENPRPLLAGAADPIDRGGLRSAVARLDRLVAEVAG